MIQCNKSNGIKLVLTMAITALLFSYGKVDNTGNDDYTLQIVVNPTKLVQQADKTIEIDNETAYNRIKPKFYNDGKRLYYTFYNSQNRKLYFSDFKTGKSIQKVQLFKEGSNSIRGNQISYFVHTKDSIFINTEFPHKYLINANGEIIAQAKIEIAKKGNLFFTEDRWEIDDPTVYKNGILYTGKRVLAPQKGASNFLRAELNFKKNSLTPTFLEEKSIVPGYEESIPKLLEMAKNRTIQEVYKFVVGEADHLFATSQINDKIQEYRNGKFVNSYYAGNPDIKIANMQQLMDMTVIKNDGKTRSISSKPNRATNYSDTFMDTNKKWIYRILIHSTYGKKNPNGPWTDVFTKAASLVVFNVDTKKSSVINLPLDKVFISYYGNRIFAMNQQLYIPTADQEIESEKRYKVFKLE